LLESNSFKVCDVMPSPTVYRGWAREYLSRAQAAPTRIRRQNFLQLAVVNTVRAQTIETEDKAARPDKPKLRKAAE